MKNLLLAIFLVFIVKYSFGQDIHPQYYSLIKEADSLYSSKDYKASAFTFSKAFNINGGKGLINDRYNAACSWALSGYLDSAFLYLDILATKASYSYYSHIVTDADLISLHSDNRWKNLLEKIKQNKRKMDEQYPLNCSNEDTEIINNDTKNAEIKSYNLDMVIDVKVKKIKVKGYVEINFNKKNSIDLVLWKNTKIEKIEHGKHNINYFFDTASESPIIYIPEGRTLKLDRLINSPEEQSIFFEYECNIGEISNWGRSFTENWIELGYYTAWYPVNAESENTISNINIFIDSLYKVSGSGIINHRGQSWEMNQSWEAFDNVIIASKDLKSKKLKDGDITVEVVYTNFPESDLDSVLLGCKNILNFYKQIYAPLSDNSNYLKFVISPTGGSGGYSRKNYISLRSNYFSTQMIMGIAHEMAHFWWNKADVNTWQDWLNEAFAEYSMLLYIKQRFGEDVFDTYIDIYKENIIRSCPIWGIDRATPEAYTSLYEKGSLILYDLEKLIGSERFFKFLHHILYENVNTTNKFLAITERDLGIEIRNWIEVKLKAENDE